ncbi:hypothetical protein MRF4_13025 [Methylobacterium radiotolerans]
MTDIILDYRERLSLKEATVQFYWRRFLRLSPPFYLAIAICFILGVGGSHRTLLSGALYLANFNMFSTSEFTDSGHFWTLSVEEQFYLLWFPVAMLCPVKRIPKILLSVILFSLLCRVHFSLYQVPNEWMLPFHNADLLCFGSLLATALRFGGQLEQQMELILKPRIALPAAAWVLAYYFNLIGWTMIYGKLVMYISMCICMTSLVRHSLSEVSCRKMDWLSVPILQHIGKISYGIYVYHYFVPQIINKFWPEIQTTLSKPYYFVLVTSISLLVAEISWLIIENPILKLKKITLLRPSILQVAR